MAIEKEAFFCQSTVMHKRLYPVLNQFVYRVFYLCFEVSKINLIRSKFLSIDRFNLFSFYKKDYGAHDGSSLEVWIRQILDQKNLNEKVKKIYLLTHPRILGYAFNPVSFWFCLNEENKLIAVLAEVNNTFGEHHNYLIFNSSHLEIGENQWLEAKKEFHVSPFFTVEGNYKFRFIFNQKNIAVWIDYLAQNSQKSLITNLICKKENLSNSKLIKGFFSIPFMTLKVIVLIHWQALKLLIKKNKYINKPSKSRSNITYNHE